MTSSLPRLSKGENLRLNAVLFAPWLIQGPVVYRPKTLPWAQRLDLAGRTVRLVDELRERHGEGPLWIDVAGKPALLVLAPRHIRQVQENAPDTFASDTATKHAVFSTFAPETVIISRGRDWADRHAFGAAMLDSASPYHRMAREFQAVCAQEVAGLVRWLGEHGGTLRYGSMANMQQRLARRLIFGDAAADDREISDWMGALAKDANLRLLGKPGKHPDWLPKLLQRIEDYLDRAEPGSLMSMSRYAPAGEHTMRANQVPHWFFNLSMTIVFPILRTLLLIASQPRIAEVVERELSGVDLGDPAALAGLSYLDGCLLETLRLYPIPPIMGRVAVQDTTFDGVTVPAGTELMILSSFNHRDERRHWFANGYEPTIWSTEAAQDWTLNPFGRGPQECGGGGLVLLVAKAVVGGLVQAGQVRPVRPILPEDQPLPYSLDPFRIQLHVSPRGVGDAEWTAKSYSVRPEFSPKPHRGSELSQVAGR